MWKRPGKNRYKAGSTVSELPPAGGWPRGYPPRNLPAQYRGAYGWFWRSMAALLILALLLVAREFPHPGGEQVREGLRYLLTTEWNYQPFLQRAVQAALQMVNVDQPYPGEITPGARQAMGPAEEAKTYQLPASGRVVRGYGWAKDPLDGLERFHPGIDIAAPPGTPVKAARDGRAARVGEDATLGRFVLLDHGDGDYTLYAGLGRLAVAEGQRVAAGQKIGEVGEKGDIKGGGLHFEVREKEKLIDPLLRLHY